MDCNKKCKCSLFGSLQCDQVWTDFVENRIKERKRLEKGKNGSISKKLTENEQKVTKK